MGLVTITATCGDTQLNYESNSFEEAHSLFDDLCKKFRDSKKYTIEMYLTHPIRTESKQDGKLEIGLETGLRACFERRITDCPPRSIEE